MIFGHKKVPLKVNIFVWRLLRNHLPTTDNLIRIMILQPNSQLSSDGCGSTKDIDHLFLTYDFFGQIWYAIYNWLDLAPVKHALVKDYLIQSKNICNDFYLSCVWIVLTGHEC